VSEAVKYGQLKSEKLAEENTVCRQIVKEIANFGVTQRQQLLIIYLLALELENTEQMQNITALVRELAGSDLLLIDQEGSDGTPRI
jgi:hypothetical protein